MSQGWRRIAVALVGAGVVCLVGCGSTRTAALQVPSGSLADDIALNEEAPRLARLQQGDAPPALAPRTESIVIAQASPKRPVVPPPPPSTGTQQTSFSPARLNKITVRAWVNGRPIFDDEVMQNIPQSALRPLANLTEAQRSEKMAELFNNLLEQIVEQEVAYQEAVNRLEKNNPRTLDKLRQLAEQDFEKQLDKVRKSTPRPSDEEIREFKRSMQRPTERAFICMEYMRSRIMPLLDSGIGYQEIKDYYDTHPNEFVRVESVKWQDVFIAVGPKHPTLDDARRFAEDLIATVRTGADFVKLTAYDDGDARTRGGEGFGTRRGEIKPAELEPILFKLRSGEIGPVVPLSTGIHIVRCVNHDSGGLMPLNETVQAQIRSKLRNQLADREYKRIMRDLKSRAIIEYVSAGAP